MTAAPFDGAKLAVLTGDRVLVLERDDRPDIPWPGHWDLPGGGREGGETPVDCVLREVREELALHLDPDRLDGGRTYPGVLPGQGTVWLFVARLDDLDPATLRLGCEGRRFALMPVAEFVRHPRAVPHLARRLGALVSAGGAAARGRLPGGDADAMCPGAPARSAGGLGGPGGTGLRGSGWFPEAGVLSGRRIQETTMKTLAEAFEHTLHDIYYAENALTKALPKVAKAAGNAELKKAVEAHLAETKEQIQILDKVFKAMGKSPKAEKCDAIEGLIKETDGLIEEAEGAALDAMLIGAAQAVEHYEIARYGTLREWAKELGHAEVHDMLTQILDMEKAANAKLTTLAVTVVNEGKTAA